MTDQSSSKQAAQDGAGYWKANIRIIPISLIIWALVSFGFGILLRPLMSGIAIGGTDLGFWFAQQGSIRRLRSDCAASGALPAQVRQVHRVGIHQ